MIAYPHSGRTLSLHPRALSQAPRAGSAPAR